MLNFDRRGDGEPLLLLHGIGMRWQWWKPCLDGLSAHHDVVAVDFPGFGESDRLPEGDEPSPIRLALAIEELVGELGLARPHVAGISMGGWVALELAKQGVVASACAISPGGLYEGWERRWADTSLRATIRLSRVLEPHVDLLTARPRLRAGLLAQVMARPARMPGREAADAFRATANSDFERTQSLLISDNFREGNAIEVPVTIAWGDKDRLLLPRQADRAVAQIPTARKVELPGCGHIPTYDDPALTVETILATTALAR